MYPESFWLIANWLSAWTMGDTAWYAGGGRIGGTTFTGGGMKVWLGGTMADTAA